MERTTISSISSNGDGVSIEGSAVNVGSVVTNIDSSVKTHVTTVHNHHYYPGSSGSVERRSLSIINLSATHTHFTGRTEELKRLHSFLCEREWRHMDPSRVAFIHGIGGMGKTEVALSFANRWRSEFSFVFTIPSESAESRGEAYLQLAKHLELTLEEKSPSTAEKAVLGHLSSAPFKKPYLLLYDKVSSQIQLPQRNGLLIITARNLEFAPKKLEFCAIPLRPLVKDEAIELLKTWTEEETSPEMEQLADRLDYYPLLLAQAGAMIANPLETVAEFVKRDTFPVPNASETGYPKGLAEALDESFEALANTNPAAYEWLQTCAYLHHKQIPLSYWERLLPNRTERGAAAAALKNSGLMQFGAKWCALDRVVQKRLRERDSNREGMQNATQVLARIQFNYERFTDFQHLRTNATTWAAHANFVLGLDLPISPENRASILEGVGRFQAHILDNNSEAIRLHEEALKLRRKTVGNDHEAIADTLFSLANIETEDKLCLDYFYQALAIYQKRCGETSEKCAETRADIGTILYNLDECEKSLEHLEQSLTIHKKQGGPSTARLLLCTADALYGLERYEEAIKRYETALESLREHYGDNHSIVVRAELDIAVCFETLERYDEVLERSERALCITTKVYGEEHMKVANLRYSMATSLRETEEYQKAYDQYKRACAIYETLQGDKCEDVANCLLYMGRCLDSLDREEETIEIRQRALKIYQELHGEEHEDVSFCLFDLGEAFRLSGEYQKAIDHHSKSLAIYKALNEEEDEHLADCWHRVAQTLVDASRPADAIQHFEIARGIYLRIDGEESEKAAELLEGIEKAKEAAQRVSARKTQIGNELLSLVTKM